MKHETIAYDVFLNDKHIDTVWFTGYTVDEAKRSLIEHDGYSADIHVQEARTWWNKRGNRVTQ